jgi:hypothetical protein
MVFLPLIGCCSIRSSDASVLLTDDPRDVLMDNIKTWKKLRDVKVTDHVNRIKTVIGYANHLEGNHLPAQADEIKHILFDVFPNHWKQEFLTSHGTV